MSGALENADNTKVCRLMLCFFLLEYKGADSSAMLPHVLLAVAEVVLWLLW